MIMILIVIQIQVITVRVPSSFSDSVLIERYSAVAVLGVFAHAVPEDQM